MPLKSIIHDGEGAGYTAGVTSDYALKVSVIQTAANSVPIAQLLRQKQLRVFFINTSGSMDLNVDGSTTSVDFSIQAEDTTTKWITAIRMILHGANFEINTNDFRRFGSATSLNTPLTNGFELYVEQEGIRTDLVAQPIQRIGEMLSYADSFINLVNSVSSQEDFLSFDMSFDVPIVIPPGTADQIICRISDDLSPITLFQIIARGYQEVQEPT